MRSLIIIYAMAMAAFAYGQSDLPVIVLSETVVDAGTVDQGTPIKHIFTFENSGTEDLRILGIERSTLDRKMARWAKE